MHIFHPSNVISDQSIIKAGPILKSIKKYVIHPSTTKFNESIYGVVTLQSFTLASFESVFNEIS